MTFITIHTWMVERLTFHEVTRWVCKAIDTRNREYIFRYAYQYRDRAESVLSNLRVSHIGRGDLEANYYKLDPERKFSFFPPDTDTCSVVRKFQVGD